MFNNKSKSRTGTHHNVQIHNPVKSMPQANHLDVKEFNGNKIFGQGFRQTLNGQSTTTLTMTLTSPGKMLIGISIIPANAGDASDTQLNFLVNNINLLNAVSADNLNPNFIGGGFLYFPESQPLQGNDTIQAVFNKNDINNIVVTVNLFYVPR